MVRRLIYVELKSGHGHNGPAWIGTGVFSRTGGTIYFDGKVLKRASGIIGNRYDLATGEEYWVSGVKQRGTNRHTGGSGDIAIDASALEEFLKLTGREALPRTGFRVVELDNAPAKEMATRMENAVPVKRSVRTLLFRPLHELSQDELAQLVRTYAEMDMTAIHKKARKSYIDRKNASEAEWLRRNGPAV